MKRKSSDPTSSTHVWHSKDLRNVSSWAITFSKNFEQIWSGHVVAPWPSEHPAWLVDTRIWRKVEVKPLLIIISYLFLSHSVNDDKTETEGWKGGSREKGRSPSRKETRGRIRIEWGIGYELSGGGAAGTLLRVYMLEADEATLQFTKRQKRQE